MVTHQPRLRTARKRRGPMLDVTDHPEIEKVGPVPAGPVCVPCHPRRSTLRRVLCVRPPRTRLVSRFKYSVHAASQLSSTSLNSATSFSLSRFKRSAFSLRFCELNTHSQTPAKSLTPRGSAQLPAASLVAATSQPRRDSMFILF